MTTATLEKKGQVGGKDRSGGGLSEAERGLLARIPQQVEYVDNAAFRGGDRDVEQKLFGEGTDVQVLAWTQFPEVPEELPRTRAVRRALKPAEERMLFLQYNYARYRMSRVLPSGKRSRNVRRAKELVRWFQRVMKCRAALVRANMALVLAMAKRTRVPNVEFGELVSEGNMALLRSIEKFDVSRGYKFSTYACRAILKGFNRLATKTGRYRSRFPREFDPSLERSDYDEKKHEMQREASVSALREILRLNRAELTEVERKIVTERFGVGGTGERHTLTEVGRMVGLTDERVRQLQKSALEKIRAKLDEEYLLV